MTWRREERENAVSVAVVSGRSFDRRNGSAADMAAVVTVRFFYKFCWSIICV